MSSLENYLKIYAESHQNFTNILLHKICVPLIVFSILGILWGFGFILENNFFINYATIISLLALVFYFKLSAKIFLVMFFYN